MSDIIIESSKVNNKETIRRLESYGRFSSMLQDQDITPYKVSKNTGIATATLSDWKNGKSMPKQDKMQKIADMLGTTVNYLINGTSVENTQEDAMLDVRISEDFELKEAIKKYYSLDGRKKKHVLELIDLLYKE